MPLHSSQGNKSENSISKKKMPYKYIFWQAYFWLLVLGGFCFLILFMVYYFPVIIAYFLIMIF